MVNVRIVRKERRTLTYGYYIRIKRGIENK